MTGNRERALAIVRQRAHQPVTLAGCNVEELAILPVAQGVAELCGVIEMYKRENRELRARLGEPESNL
jgi:hypothetical protein